MAITGFGYCSEVAFRNISSTDIQKQLHLANLGINLLHKLNDEIHQFMLQHRLRMKIRNQKRNIIALNEQSAIALNPKHSRCGDGWRGRYRHRLPPKNDKILSATSEESSQLVRQNPLDIIGLFDFDADADRVDRRFNQHLFVFSTGDVHWIQHDFRRCPKHQQKEGERYSGGMTLLLFQGRCVVLRLGRRNSQGRGRR